MSDLLAQIESNFAKRARNSMQMPEWSAEGATPVVVYYRAPNPATIGKCRDDSGGKSVEFMARLVVAVVEDEDGKRLFQAAAYKNLMISCPPAALQRLADSIMSTAFVDVEAAEKN